MLFGIQMPVEYRSGDEIVRLITQCFTSGLDRWVFKSIYLHWGSEFQTSLDFEWSKRGLVGNGPDFEWDLKSGSPTTFKIWTNGCHSVKKYLKSRQKHPDFDWSVFSNGWDLSFSHS